MNTKLSININKIALLRNSRGNNVPDILKFAKDCESYGSDGITIHPRPDERHIKYKDAYDLKEVVKTELNIEGYPDERFLKMVCEVQPHQCTLVPDAPGALTSDNGWDTISNQNFLKEVVSRLQEKNIRVSLFINPDKEMLDAAKNTGTDRIEFYTGPFAHDFYKQKEIAIQPFKTASIYCEQIDLGINAGHDLNLDNLKYFKENTNSLLEVSIGHALVKDALYFGIENTVNMYKRLLK
jgi:pyridoxine 5-phosphate synthase